jgi:peptide/nickel transport system substrate-binding protein
MGALGRAITILAGVPIAIAASSAETPKHGGFLNFAVVAEPANYDCHASQTFALLHPVGPLYSYLVKYDSSRGGEIVGDLAKSWTVSPDGLVYTFTLHEGVTFHDGSPLTSADVKATFERIADPPPGIVSLRKSSMQDLQRMDTPDAATVSFTLKAVNAAMLDSLASPFNCIYSAAKLKEDQRFPENNILGSGAFQLVEYVRGSYLAARRYDGYFRKGLPYLDGYKAFFVKSNGVVPGMLGGQFDVEFRGRTPSERNRLLAVPDKEKWVVQEGPWATVDTVIFNTTHKPFDDPRVRRALSLAIDRWGGNEALSKITFVKATGGFLRPGYAYALPDAELLKTPGYGKDIEQARAEARALLKEAGAEHLAFKLHNRTVGEPYTPVGIFLIDQWKRIGVSVEHSQVETRPYFASLVDGTFDVALYPVTAPADEASVQHQSYLTNALSPISYSRHSDTTLDALWQRQSRTLDPEKRKAIVHEFERHLLAENYTLSINWWQRIVVHHKKIKGWYFSPSHFQGQELTEVWLDE